MLDSQTVTEPQSMSNRRFWLWIGGAAVAVVLGCWAYSGTMAPYGTDVYSDCHYRTNGDDHHFRAVFWMIDGHPPAEWQSSVVLRRILHPLLAYPFMKAFGFDFGGLLFNFIAHAAALIGLAIALRRYFDARAAVIASWLFATCPAYAYWGGLPFSYAIIVPFSVGCAIALLWWNDRPSLVRTCITACVIGCSGLGYDLVAAFYSIAFLFLLAGKRRWLDILPTLVLFALWTWVMARGIGAIYGFAANNNNTSAYPAIVRSWLDAPHRTTGWGTLLWGLPRVFAGNFFYSNAIFVPAVLLVATALKLFKPRIRPLFGPVGLAILLSGLAMFLFLNAAPPYNDAWQLRGSWVPRFYQPIFPGILIVAAATSVALREDRLRYRIFFWSCIASIALGVGALAGPFARFDYLYLKTNENFYQHWSLAKNETWFKKIGRRPYGVCG